MRDDGPSDPAGRISKDADGSPEADARARHVGDRDAGRARRRLDPEALSVAIGARRRELVAMAERRRAAAAPDADRGRKSGRVRARRFRRDAAAASFLVILVAGGIAGFYWGLGIVAPEPPGSGADPAPTLSTGELQTVERLLARLDFRVGAIDGRIDPRTRAAIRRYRRYQGLPTQQGRPTPRLLANLRDVAALTGADDGD